MSQRVVFITGTDTGVGKTVLTSLLLIHAQQRETGKVAALKPFSSGGRSDAHLLYELQDGQLALDVINPFHFAEPLSPWTAAKLERPYIKLEEALQAIRSVSADLLVAEGAGGLLAPLGEGFTALDLITALASEVIITAANRLGVLNHTLLTLAALRQSGVRKVKICLMNGFSEDPSVVHNENDLRELSGVPIVSVPDLGAELDAGALRAAADKLSPQLKDLFEPIRG